MKLTEIFEAVYRESCNIEYKKGWIQKKNPEPEKLHNKFKKDEKEGIPCPFGATIEDCGFEGGLD